MKDFIRLCDFNGVEAQFHTGKESKTFKNIFGGVLSIMCFIGIVAAIIYFFLQFINRKSLTLMTNIITTENIKIYDFHDYPIFFRVSTSSAVPLDNPSSIWKSTANLATMDPAVNSSYTRIFFPVEPCDLQTHYTKYSELIQASVPDFSTYFCINWGNFTLNLTGSYGSPTFNQALNLRIRSCADEIGDICSNSSYVSSTLKDALLDIRVLDVMIDNSNVDVQNNYIYGERIGISNSVYRRILISFREIQYESDFGFVFESKTVLSFNQYETYRTETDLRSYNSNRSDISNYKVFAWANIIASKTKSIHQRSYLKAQSALANVGGIIQVLITLTTVIGYPISKSLYELELINSISLSQERAEIMKDTVCYDVNEAHGKVMYSSKFQLTKLEHKDSFSQEFAQSKINMNINHNLTPIKQRNFDLIDNNNNKIKPRNFEDELNLHLKSQKLNLYLHEILLPKFCFCDHKKKHFYEAKLKAANEAISIFNYIKMSQEFNNLKQNFSIESEKLDQVRVLTKSNSEGLNIIKELIDTLKHKC